MSYSLLGLDEPANPVGNKKPTSSSNKYSLLGLDDVSSAPVAPIEAPKPIQVSQFPSYDTVSKENGKQDTSVWSKISNFLKPATDMASSAITGTLDWWNSAKKADDEQSFRIRQLTGAGGDDPLRTVKDPVTGKTKLTNNALEAYDAAKTPEEKAKILSEDAQKLPVLKSLNSILDSGIGATLSEKTSNVPLKSLVRFATTGEQILQAFSDPSFENFSKAYKTYSGTDTEQYNQNLKYAIDKSNDRNNPRWQKILYGVQNSGVQSAIGTLLSVGTTLATKSPRLGAAVGTGYFGLLSAEEEKAKYPGGKIDSTSALGNIAIDTVGDQMIGNIAETALKNFAKESSKATLKSIGQEAVKGFAVEGGTEPTQSLLKYANDYTNARTEDRKKAVVNDFSNYIKSGAMLDEFLVGGLSGAAINTFAAGAGAINSPVHDSNGKEITPEKIDAIQSDVAGAVTKALETGNFEDVVNLVAKKHDLPEDQAAKVVQGAAQDVIAENAHRDAPQGSPEHVAIENDVIQLIKQGQSPADISEQLQSVINFSQEYADNVVATALAKVNAEAEVQAKKLEETQAKVNELEQNAKKSVITFDEITQKLTEAQVSQDVSSKIGNDLLVAINKEGTQKEKNAAIKLLSNPANETARSVYSELTGIELPQSQEESKTVLSQEISPTVGRKYARQVITGSIKTPNGYRNAVASGIPEYIPEELRSKTLIDEANNYIENGTRPPKENKNLIRVYNALNNQVGKVEAQFEADTIDMDSKTLPSDANSTIPFYTAGAQINDESLISMEEAEKIVRSYFRAKEVPLTFVKNIRTPAGGEAWGKYSKGVIHLIENPSVASPHHESVHAFLDLFIPEYERENFLATAYNEAIEKDGKEKVDKDIEHLSNLYNNKLSHAQIIEIYSEERLADGFYEYVQGRNQKTAFAKFYDAVIAFLKSIRGDFDASRLYEEIIAKKRYNSKLTRETMRVVENTKYTKSGDNLFSVKSPKLQTPLEKEALKYDNVDDFIKSQEDISPEYGMDHRPSKDGSGYDLSDADIVGEDIYDKPHFYNIRLSNKANKESFDVVKQMRGKPDMEVTVYRASPKNELNNGDWISLSKTYAMGESVQEGTKVNSFKVKAKDIQFSGDSIDEFGYFPTEETLKDIYNSVHMNTAMFSPKGKTIEQKLSDIIEYKNKLIEEDNKKVDEMANRLGYTNIQKEIYKENHNHLQSQKIADAHKYAAIKRGLTGNLTNIEAQNIRKYLEGAYIGRKMRYDGKDVIVMSKPAFGNIRILVDGVEKSVPRQKLIGENITNQMILDYAKKEATKDAEAEIAKYGTSAEHNAAQIVKSSTYSKKPFENLSEKVPVFKNATEANTETQAINLGKEKVAVEGAKIQKASGKTDGLFTDAYTVVINRGGKERVIFSSENDQEAIDWLKKHAGKETTVDNNQTASVFIDGNDAHVIVTDESIIPMETSSVAGTTSATNVTFYDTTGKKLETKEITPENSDFKPVAVVKTNDGEQTVSNQTLSKEELLKSKFPSYFAVINSKPVLVHNDIVPVPTETYLNENKIVRSKKDQTSQLPIEPNLNEGAKVKKSTAFKKASSRLAEEFQQDATYTALRIDDQMAKAFELLDTNPEYAKAVALGIEQPPLDITDTAISLAVAERAKETGDYETQAAVEKARSLRQTRRGQELVLERGRVDENSPEFFIRQLLQRRKELAQAKYKAILSKSKPFIELLDERVTEAKKKASKKLKSELEIKGEELDSFLEEMMC